MVHTILWLTILGVALLIPNVLAIRFALLGVGDPVPAIPARTSAPARAAAQARPSVKRPSPRFVRGGYLWKALSPILFGVSFILGLAIQGPVGYGIMAAGLLNMIWGFLGWDAYIPGKWGQR
ncbi:MAG: hypothetical protein ACOY93_07450 [Bacillota bacterium]